MNAEPVEKIMQRIRSVPDQYREFTEGAEEAAKIHKIPEDLLPEMLDLGLPCRASKSGYRFDRTDLENVALSLRFRCPRYVAMKWWARSLNTIIEDEQIEFNLQITPKCPQTGHLGPCAFSASSHLEGAVAPNSLAVSQAGVVTARVCLPTKKVIFTGAYTELFDRLAGLTLHIFPESMPVESWIAHETGLADCRVAARLLVQGAAELGLVARPASGFFMAAPFPMRHVWVEFETAGSWVSADPFLLQALERWGIVDGEQWPIYRSPPGLLWKLQSTDEIDTPLMFHAGQESLSSCVIRRRLYRRAAGLFMILGATGRTSPAWPARCEVSPAQPEQAPKTPPPKPRKSNDMRTGINRLREVIHQALAADAREPTGQHTRNRTISANHELRTVCRGPQRPWTRYPHHTNSEYLQLGLIYFGLRGQRFSQCELLLPPNSDG